MGVGNSGENTQREEGLFQNKGEWLCGRERGLQKQERVTESLGKGLPIVGNLKPTIQIDCEPNYR